MQCTSGRRPSFRRRWFGTKKGSSRSAKKKFANENSTVSGDGHRKPVGPLKTEGGEDEVVIGIGKKSSGMKFRMLEREKQPVELATEVN